MSSFSLYSCLCCPSSNLIPGPVSKMNHHTVENSENDREFPLVEFLDDCFLFTSDDVAVWPALGRGV